MRNSNEQERKKKKLRRKTHKNVTKEKLKDSSPPRLDPRLIIHSRKAIFASHCTMSKHTKRRRKRNNERSNIQRYKKNMEKNRVFFILQFSSSILFHRYCLLSLVSFHICVYNNISGYATAIYLFHYCCTCDAAAHG